MEESIKCPSCQSTQVQAGKRGWSMATGMIRSGDVLITCLKCGEQFKPGQDYDAKAEGRTPKSDSSGAVIVIIIVFFLLLLVILASSCSSNSTKVMNLKSLDSIDIDNGIGQKVRVNIDVFDSSRLDSLHFDRVKTSSLIIQTSLKAKNSLKNPLSYEVIPGVGIRWVSVHIDNKTEDSLSDLQDSLNMLSYNDSLWKTKKWLIENLGKTYAKSQYEDEKETFTPKKRISSIIIVWSYIGQNSFGVKSELMSTSEYSLRGDEISQEVFGN